MAASRDDAGSGLFRYRFGTAEFDQARFELRVARQVVDVQRKPLEVLVQLLTHAGEVVTKDELLESVWQGRTTVENVVGNAIAKLRAALGDGNADCIVTHPRIGYRFAGALDRMSVGHTPAHRLQFEPGAPLPSRPHFVLERLLGSSRRSEVWLARHLKTDERRVYKFSADGEGLTTLKREATLSRLLRHAFPERDDFARVVDWNFETSPFFLECEFAGQNLLEWAADNNLARLTTAQRLEMFLSIADAVAAAHSIGVLHKDLKPTNALIAAPEPKEDNGSWKVRLADFGSSRLLDPQRLQEMGITQLGLTLTVGALNNSSDGTPLYLAPELIDGQPPTVRSDLYALGIMLYQLLTGNLRQPMVAGWERGIEDELLRKDIAHATDGDAVRRFASVAEFAASLRAIDQRREEQRRLRADTQSAQAAQQALQRALARRPWIAASFVLLVCGLGISLWQYRTVEDSRARVMNVNAFLNWEVLANTGVLNTDGDQEPTMRRALANAATTVGGHFKNDPGNEGYIRLAIGEGLVGLGEYAASEEQQRMAISLLGKGYGKSDDRTLDAMYTLAENLLIVEKFKEVGPVIDEADRLLKEHSSHQQVLLLKAHSVRAGYHASRRECALALENLHSAQGVQQKRPGRAYDRFVILSSIAENLICLGRYQQAMTIYRDLLNATKYPRAEVGGAQVGYAMLMVADLLRSQGQASEGEASLSNGLKIFQSAIGSTDPVNTARALVRAGEFYASLGGFDDARQYYVKAQRLLAERVEGRALRFACERDLAVLDYLDGRASQAALGLHALRDAATDVFGAGTPEVDGTDYWLASALIDAGHPDKAAALAEPLRPETLRASLGGDGWQARLQALRARILIAQGQTEAGRKELTSAISHLTEARAPHWLIARFQAEFDIR